jgi:hypothetical protein
MQRRIAGIVQPEPSNGINPTNSVVEHSEMRQANDTTAANDICSTFVAKLMKSFHVVKQA